jgi:signal transduction histidine kinase
LEAGNLKLDLAEFSVHHLISAALDSSLQLAENRKIRLSQEGPDLIVEADDERLIQVLINLVSNAIKFSPPDSQITVKVEDQPALVKISVCDLGRGVPIASRDAIFERFKQVEKTDSSELGGVGLGLPICKMLVEMHGGKIGVEDNAPAGSRFWFTINK